MTPPDDTDEAEVYVEGKRKMVEGFIRWCQKGDVGLNQKSTVVAVVEEEPTGLYDGFYVKTKA
jgi:acylphosphatase